MIKRFQALLVIYINIIMTFFYIMWILLGLLGFQLHYYLEFSLGFLPLMILSLIFLKAGHNHLPAICILGYFQILILVSVNVTNMSLCGICGVIALPIYGFLLSSSNKIHWVNVSLTLVQDIILIVQINRKFKITFTEEQAAEISPVNFICFMTMVLVTIFCFIQKKVETTLWRFAQENYERTLSVTKELVEAAEAKDIFVSSLSYEIQSPLNNIKTVIDSLLQKVKDSSEIQVIRNIKLNAEILSNIVGNLLDIAKIKSDKIELSFKESGSIDLLKKVMMIHMDSLKEKEIETRVLIDKNLPSCLWIDSPRVLQIILNVFSNALKFTAKHGRILLIASWRNEEQNHETLFRFMKENKRESSGRQLQESSEELRISYDRHSWSSQIFDEFSEAESSVRSRNLKDLRSVRFKTTEEEIQYRSDRAQRFFEWKMDRSHELKDTQELLEDLFAFVRRQENVAEKGYLVMQVTDTGCGIPQENLAKLFKRYSHIDHNVPHVQREKGLGLWMTKQLCKKMGGDIVVESQVNRGSTFAFYIPVNNVNLIEASRNRSSRRVTRDKMRALVVDDYGYNRDLHKLLVEREGVQQVVTASDGREAVERYISKGDDYYDFIMMDIQMPEMDGFTADQKIRHHEEEQKWKKVDIYFVSGEY